LRGVFFYAMDLYKNFLKSLNSTVSATNRNIDDINLIAVSKKKSVDEIKVIIESGQLLFGENQIQEVEKKWIKLKTEYPKVKLHFIGGIQSKKAKSIFLHCDVIHSIDRMKIVDIFSELENQYKISREYFIQINIGDEPQKGGVRLSDVDEFIVNCLQNYKLKVTGLMCLPPFGDDPKKYFIKLKNIADKYNIPSLSMGMSGDYQVALECGATHIRIGTHIFGERS
jgi:pyridoxal phosphate enzyme (YggS family)